MREDGTLERSQYRHYYLKAKGGSYRSISHMKAQMGVEGIKIQVAGRLNGAEIARTEWTREGRVPLHTLRADIDYSYKTASTIYGILGIKVWVFKGEVLPGADLQQNNREAPSRRRQQRRRQQFEDRSEKDS